MYGKKSNTMSSSQDQGLATIRRASKRLLQQEVQQLYTIGNHTTRDWPVCTAFEDLLRRSGEEAFATKIAVRGTNLRDIAVNRAGFSSDGKLARGEANERRKGCMCANDPSLSFS